RSADAPITWPIPAAGPTIASRERQRGRGPPQQPVPTVRAHARPARRGPGGGPGRPRCGRRPRPRPHARPAAGPPPRRMTEAATVGAAVVGRYRPPVAGYDEMVDRAGSLRPHWAQIGAVLDGLGLDELGRR